MGIPLHIGNDVLAISATIPRESGLNAHRIILRYFPESAQPYVTHLNVMPEGAPSFYVHGHYFNKLSDALNDFAARTLDRLTLQRNDHHRNEHGGD